MIYMNICKVTITWSHVHRLRKLRAVDKTLKPKQLQTNLHMFAKILSWGKTSLKQVRTNKSQLLLELIIGVEIEKQVMKVSPLPPGDGGGGGGTR